jgi:transglutaminase-like putative cysteine protease
MPVYKIKHITRYRYEQPVTICHHIAHLLPREAPRHLWSFADLEISPSAVRTDRLDYFGNRQTFFSIQEPHRELLVTSRSEVDILPPSTGMLFSNQPWEQARDGLWNIPSPDFGGVIQFTFESTKIAQPPEAARYAAESFTPGRPVMEALADLMARIHQDFEFDSSATTVGTSVAEVLRHRKGVCQDFAHLGIACLRSMGFAARYISGYLLTLPPPGKPRMVGTDASHAWLAVYVPELGWLEFDPTNNMVPAERHITIAHGRDFSDVSPLRGVILGGGKHAVHVSVDVAAA